MEQHPGDTSTKDDGQEGDRIQESSQEQDSPAETEKLPMSGVWVIDVGTFFAGPYAASILGEFGAEILKVEHPIAGDPMRRFRRYWDLRRFALTRFISRTKGSSLQALLSSP
jgi:hypothetical protein